MRHLPGHRNRQQALLVALTAIRGLGLRIPDDLSVVGFDGTPFSTFVVPSLSTIIRQTDEMAALGAHKLLAQINEGPEAAAAFDTLVSPRFVPRESTGPVPVS